MSVLLRLINRSDICAAVAVAAALTATPVQAAIKLPALISDHAVLKRSPATRLWGTAAPGETISIKWPGQTVSTTADAKGDWSTTIDLSRAGAAPFELVFKGTTELHVKDVVAGEVWLASGQSNIEFQIEAAVGGKEEAGKPRRPELRFFYVGLGSSKTPAREAHGKWVVAAPNSIGYMSAVAYFFAQGVQREIGRPVGIIQSLWGGSSLEAWTSPDALDSVPALKAAKDKYWNLADEVESKRKSYTPDLKKWLADTGRQDRLASEPASKPEAFASPTAGTDGWTPVDVAGGVTGQNLPTNGAIWLRRVVNVPQSFAERGTTLIYTSNAIEQVYWNGKLLRSRAIEDYFEPSVNYLNLSPDQLKAGEGVLAMRMYAPLSPLAFVDGPPILLGQQLRTGWIAKAEYALDAAPAQPAPPALPPTGLAAQRVPAFLYNAMIAPLTHMTLSGVIWYQGEDNAPRAVQYKTAFPLMIQNWRSKFDQPNLPFLFCQLPAYGGKRDTTGDSAWAELREAQTETLKLPHTAEAVLIDTGDANNIHPIDKRPAGERLAKLALRDVYGKTAASVTGPTYKRFEISGGHIAVRFQHQGRLQAASLPDRYSVNSLNGETAKLELNSAGSELEGFQICGADKKWVWAQARIDGDDVVVSSPAVPAPIAVRYAWADNPTCNLTDASGLPAGPFRTDDFPLSTVNGTMQ